MLRTVRYLASNVLVSLVFSVQLANAQTSIVAIKNTREVVLAADSKVTQVAPDGTITALSLCKISRTESTYFSSAALGLETSTGFDADSIAAEALRNGKTIEKSVAIFDSLVEAPLVNALRAAKQQHLMQYYSENLNKTGLQIVFVGFEREEPVLCFAWYTTNDSSPLDLSVTAHFGGTCSPNAKTVEATFLGQHEAIDNFLKANPTFTNAFRSVPELAARKLVEVEIADKPSEVGPPIDTLIIDSKGARPFKMKPGCPVIK